MKELTEAVKKLFPQGGVIGFASFGHGMGRSFVKKKVEEVLKGDPELRDRVVSLSTGDVFRKIARERGFEDIGEFARWMREHPEEAIEVDTTIDKTIQKRIRELVKEGRIVLIDSNLHAWPFALREIPHVTFVIYARPDVVGERLMKVRREGERKYSSPEEAVEAQLQRALEDSNRYLVLASKVDDPELRELYRKGGLMLRRLVRAYRLWLWKGLKDVRIVRELKGMGVYVADNSGRVEKTIRSILEKLLLSNLLSSN